MYVVNLYDSCNIFQFTFPLKPEISQRYLAPPLSRGGGVRHVETQHAHSNRILLLFSLIARQLFLLFSYYFTRTFFPAPKEKRMTSKKLFRVSNIKRVPELSSRGKEITNTHPSTLRNNNNNP